MGALLRAVRGLTRSPGFLLTAVVTLALGIGAGVAAFSVIDAVRFRALPYRDGSRLVVIDETQTAGDQATQTTVCRGTCDVSYETFATVLKTFPFRRADLVAGFTSGAKALNQGGEPIVVSGGVISYNLFDLLGVEPLLGRRFSAEDDRLGAPPVTVISHDLWTNNLGGSKDIIGQTVKLSDTRYTIIGVMPPGFDHEVGSKFWLASVPTLDPSTRPSIRSLTVVARLVPGATLEQFNAELRSIDANLLRKTLPNGAVTSTLSASPLRDRYVSSTQSHDLIFAAVVGCILLIAVTNLANLMLVRTLHQQRELAIQSALGAGIGRIVRRLLAEQSLVVATATVLGIAFARLVLGVLESVAVLQSLRPVGMEYQLDGRAIGFAVLLAVVIVTVLSLVPIALSRRTDVQSVLRQGAPATGGGAWARGAQQGFVVAQLTAAVVLLVGAGLMTKTVLRLARLDLGFESDRLIDGNPSFPHPWRVKEKYVPVTRQIVAELALLPGAGRVAIRAQAPLAPRGAPTAITLEGQTSPLPAGVVPATGVAVDTGYFATLGIPVVRGRTFAASDIETGPAVAIVNQWAAERWWAGVNPIGHVVRIDTAPGLSLGLEIVGVVGNNRAASAGLLLAQEGAELYRPIEQAPSPFPTFVLRASGPTGPLLKPIKETLARLVPDRPLSATPVQTQVDQLLSGVRVNAYQILAFALIGLALAIVGVYGVLSYAVGRRTREIGIRGALGASREAIGKLIVKDAIKLATIAIAVGLPIAMVAAKSLASILYGTNPSDPIVLVTVTIGVLVVAVVASWWPARRASRVDPLVALRGD